MEEVVVCWCCEFFVLNDNKFPKSSPLDDGYCIFTQKSCHSFAEVCEDYLFRSGLYTKRKIPDKCKRYKKD